MRPQGDPVVRNREQFGVGKKPENRRTSDIKTLVLENQIKAFKKANVQPKEIALEM